MTAAAVVAEVRSAFEAYERALIGNDVAAMDAAFWDDERVVRFGLAEIQHGYAEVAAWRVERGRAHSNASPNMIRNQPGPSRTNRRGW